MRASGDRRPHGPTLEGHDGQALEGRRDDGRGCGGERLDLFLVIEIAYVNDPRLRWQLHVRLAGEHERELWSTLGSVAPKMIEHLRNSFPYVETADVENKLAEPVTTAKAVGRLRCRRIDADPRHFPLALDAEHLAGEIALLRRVPDERTRQPKERVEDVEARGRLIVESWNEHALAGDQREPEVRRVVEIREEHERVEASARLFQIVEELRRPRPLADHPVELVLDRMWRLVQPLG